MGRGQGFDTGVALLTTVPGIVNIRVFLPTGFSPLGIPGIDVLEANYQMPAFRDDFFLNEVGLEPELPEVIPAALVEMTVELGEMYAVALGLQVEGGTIQIAGQNATVIDPIQ